ncbi:MAG TPA: DUF4864 domain-containing protein [Lacipirellulaceae bacterium]|nr:DUF4864 domain-containing protein [Lacipirellulaceae bacterium]
MNCFAGGESSAAAAVASKSEVQPRAAEVAAEPSSQLSAEDVVRAQMSALAGEGAVMKRIERCYRFASPANREHTGPIEHFAQMVRAPQYASLLAAKHFLVGKASQEKDSAFILVTTIDPAGELTLFRFFLSKQTKSPFAGCWMTDAVIRVGTVKKSGDSEKPLNDGEPI